MASKYTQATIRWLKKQNITYSNVEKYNAFSRRSKDLFGIIDFLLLANGRVVGLQSTSYKDRYSHFKDIKASPYAIEWLNSGALLYLVGWEKCGARYVPHWFEFKLSTEQPCLPTQFPLLADWFQDQSKP